MQYASIAYRQRLASHDVILSMSRPGNPFDNAKAESFMKTLKYEELNARSFRSIHEASLRIDQKRLEVVFVSNLTHEKGIGDVLQLVELFRGREDVHFRIAGPAMDVQ